MIVSEILAEVAKGNFSVISHLSDDELEKCIDHVDERDALITRAIARSRYVPSIIDGACKVLANLATQQLVWRAQDRAAQII